MSGDTVMLIYFAGMPVIWLAAWIIRLLEKAYANLPSHNREPSELIVLAAMGAALWPAIPIVGVIAGLWILGTKLQDKLAEKIRESRKNKLSTK